jgi:hypothetical protein
LRQAFVVRRQAVERLEDFVKGGALARVVEAAEELADADGRLADFGRKMKGGNCK